MPKRPNPEWIDHDNSEWTAQDMTRARPAKDVLLGLLGAKAAKALLSPRGHPPAQAAKHPNTP
jgi:hypothetical protein